MHLSKVFKADDHKETKDLLLNPIVPFCDSDNGRLDAVEKEAYGRGFEAGRRAGLAVGEREAGILIDRFASILKELDELRAGYYRDKEEELVDMVIKVAGKVVHGEVSINRDIVLNVIKAAIEAINSKSNLVVRLNPEDLEYIKEKRADILDRFKEIDGISLQGDPEIGRGGCILQNEDGEVDARIEEALKLIEGRMKEAIER